MDSPIFINTQIKEGVWQGDLPGSANATPALQATHLGTTLANVAVTFDITHSVWRVRVPIPATVINDGIQTITIADASGTTITSFSLVAGKPLADDLRAEIALLRGELEVLKRAFRQHCAE